MKTFLIGVAAAGLVGVTIASAEEQSKSQTTSSSQSSTTLPSTGQPSSQPSSQPSTTLPSSQPSTTLPSSQTSTSQASSGQTGTTASASNELSGVVKKIDKDKRSLKISSLTGKDQDLKVATSATITRDGTQSSLDQIKEGDEVRASFDASGSQVSKIDVNSKQKMKSGDKDKSDSKPQSKDKN